VGGRSPSDSDVIAVEVEAIERDRREVLFVSIVVVVEGRRLLRFSFSLLPDLDPTACVPAFFRRDRVKVRDI
jgi:hypothetical protein